MCPNVSQKESKRLELHGDVRQEGHIKENLEKNREPREILFKEIVIRVNVRSHTDAY